MKTLMKSEPVKSENEQGGRCRFCDAALTREFIDLGTSPLCESYVAAEWFNHAEPFYPLRVYVCEQCWLVQVQEYVRAENIYSDYAYFSSYSDSWLKHASDYVDAITARLKLGKQSLVAELASNDGYLLQYFMKKGIPVVGIDPAANVAEVARAKGIETVVKFFGEAVGQEVRERYGAADLIVGNNVLAHVPDIKDFVAGMKQLLKPGGTITMEFPHLLKLVAENQFDTIYHEHFSYLSLTAVQRIFKSLGLEVFDVEEIKTHGGSLRIYAHHLDEKPIGPAVKNLLAREAEVGIEDAAYYTQFTERVRETKRKLLEFLIEAKRAGKTVVGYGAPGKGNTLLNYCGIRTDFVDYTVDRSPHKQGKFLPGTRIPIFHPDRIAQTQPDYVLILPWNLKDEIVKQMAFVKDWGGKFVVPIPEVMVVE